MSPRTWLDRIRDILACAKNIRDFSDGMTLDAFLSDPRTVRAVAFEFTTIGESARVIPVEIQERYPDIPWGNAGHQECVGTRIFPVGGRDTLEGSTRRHTTIDRCIGKNYRD